MSYAAYPAAFGLAVASAVSIALISGPLWWHFCNRNIGATCLVAWFILLNSFSFINALIWPTDDIGNWYNGSGLCDVEVKFMVAARVGIPASAACILRALARVMDTNRTTLGQTSAQKRRSQAIDLLWALGLPLLMFLAHFIVQPNRYYLFGISGCVVSVDNSWLSVLLVQVPGVLWTLLDSYYAVLILARLHKYRQSFTSLLVSNGTTKSRFLRLFCLCTVWLLVALPVQLYVLFLNTNILHNPFKWSVTHDRATWNQIIMVPSKGTVVYERYTWLASGIVVFIFFGMGRDAMAMYRSGLCVLGLARIFPTLRRDYQASPTGSRGSALDSISSKAKMLFSRKLSIRSWQTESMQSQSTCVTDTSMEPKTTSHLEAIQEDPRCHNKSSPPSVKAEQRRRGPPNDQSERKGLLGFLSRAFRSKQHPNIVVLDDAIHLHGVTCQQASVSANVGSGEGLLHVSPPRDSEVLVRREVRQGSVRIEEIPESVFRGV